MRVFAYDGLSRLTSATNPENGTIFYSYDLNGNLKQKIDARGAVTDLVYNDINQLTNRNYTVPSGTADTPNVTYTYGATPTSCGNYSKGRLCSVSSSKSTTDYTYGHPRGLVTASNQDHRRPDLRVQLRLHAGRSNQS